MTADLRVLMSFRKPRPTSNPYLSLLWDGLRASPGVEPVYFSWREALCGQWDVLHVQWPETLMVGSTWWRRRINEARYALLLARVRLTRRGLVRTAHNLTAHTPTSAVGGRLAQLTQRWADHVIRLNEATPVRPGQAVSTVVHGHYRDWYHAPAVVKPVPGRVLFFGLIRPYKGIDELLEAFAGAPGEPGESAVGLRIVGAPADPALAAQIATAAEADDRIECDLRHLDDDELAAEIAAASLIVLPYRELHNSGALLLALSLDRPVLVPGGEVTDALAAEVGPVWVQRYDPARSVQIGDLEAALVATAGRQGRPDLSARDWTRAGLAHRSAYRASRSAARAH